MDAALTAIYVAVNEVYAAVNAAVAHKKSGKFLRCCGQACALVLFKIFFKGFYI